MVLRPRVADVDERLLLPHVEVRLGVERREELPQPDERLLLERLELLLERLELLLNPPPRRP